MDKNSIAGIETNFNNFRINDSKYDTTDSKENSENFATFSSVQKYLKEWEDLFSGDKLKWKDVCTSARSGGLRTSYFRSVCWRMMLDILPANRPSEWSATISKLRVDYDLLKKEIFISPHEEDNPNIDHPLSQDAQQSKWHKYFCDNELKAVIKQDVIRTFPGVEFFQDPQIQDQMLNILFCYARKNPEMCYRQGMHEILAPVLFVLNFDIENFFCVRETEELSEIISQLMNPDYLEHDSFCIFNSLMEAVEIYYQTSGMIPTSSGYFPPRAQLNSPMNENPVVTQLSYIKEYILKPVDPDLDAHLTELLIPFSTFGIRWLRLLFGREFEFEDLLVLWDALFAEGPNLTLINFIVVALLLKIRYNLLRCDFTECLALLMQYPHGVGVVEIVQLAIELRDASRSEKGLCPLFKSTAVNATSDQNQTQAGAKKKENPRLRRPPNLRPTPASSRKSVIDGIAFNVQWAVSVAQYTTFYNFDVSIGAKQKSNLKSVIDQSEARVVFGSNRYIERNKTKNLQEELNHMQMLLTICKDKLAHYHKVLDASVLSGNTPARQAVEGLSQLHLLLEDYTARMEPKRIEPAANEIETASEAGESPSVLTGSAASQNKLANSRQIYERELKEFTNRSCTVDEAQQADQGSMSKFPTVNPVGSR